jgi:hypothetical protein
MTAAELVERVRDTLEDYGDVEEGTASALTLQAEIADDEIEVEDASLFDMGDWLHVGNEVMEVSEEISPSTNIVPVRRAMKGTTAALHLEGALVRANLKFSNKRILDAINSALAGGFPMLAKVAEDVSLTVTEGQRLYTLSAAVRDIRSVWLEDEEGSGEYLLTRLAAPKSRSTFILHGSHTAGLGIKVVTTTTFPRLTTSSSMDSTFPDDDEAYDYLVKDAAGRLLLGQTGARALSDATPARGTQGQDDRYVLINTAKALRADAKESLRKCRMQLPTRITPRPDARYFG